MFPLKLFSLFILLFFSCANGQVVESNHKEAIVKSAQKSIILMGAERMDLYLHKLKGKKIGLVANQTATVSGRHLADTLLSQGIQLMAIFSPEHGFRGKADAGAKVKDGQDPLTGLPVISLYGKNRKPTQKQLEGIDLLVFDIQDVGARFYTYISTLHYVLEACAENDIPVLILDRPNPNGHYVDGPVLDIAFKSFVGMHPVPIVHGMTIGEYGRMIVGEGWLQNGVTAKLEVITCENYTHQTPYALPINPSPNLPNQKSILLYPSLCLFEGTVISVGRGTHNQFQLYGHPNFSKGDTTFSPTPLPGAKHPKLEGKTCKGFNLSKLTLDETLKMKFNIGYLVTAYAQFPNKEKFFLKNNFFDKLAGSDRLRKQIKAGLSAEEIEATWQAELKKFNKTRSKYLLYD